MCTIVPKISSEEEFERLCAKVHKQEWEIEGGQPFRFILIEESHVENQSIMILAIHHTFGDGITFVAVMNAVAENGFVGLANLQTGQAHTKMDELKGLKAGVENFVQVLRNYNPFMKQPEDCNHRYLFSKNLPIGNMKAACKKFKMPLQPTIFAIVSASIKEYQDRRNIKRDRMPIASAFSLRGIPRNEKEITGGNAIVSIMGDLMITDNLKKNLRSMRPPDLIQAKGKYYLAMFLTALPYGLGRELLANQDIEES